MTLPEFLLAYVESRAAWLGLRPPLPARDARFSVLRVAALVAWQTLLGAGLGLVISLIGAGEPLGWVIWLLGLFGACQGAVLYGLTALCWNRRAAALRVNPDMPVALPPSRFRPGRWALGAAYFGLIMLATPLMMLLTIENARGRVAWELFRRNWEAKGERFDWASFLPEPVPPEQNFAMTPLLAPLFDYEYADGKIEWRDSNALARLESIRVDGAPDYASTAPAFGSWQKQEFCDLRAWQEFYRTNVNFQSNPSAETAAEAVLSALRKYDPVLDELRMAIQRPYAVYPADSDPMLGASLPLLTFHKAICQVLVLRALANLEAGRPQEALADVELNLRLASTLDSVPTLLFQLVKAAVVTVGLQPVWEGLARRQWNERQLGKLQQLLASINMLESCSRAIRGERAWSIVYLEYLRSGQSPGTRAPGLAKWLPRPGRAFSWQKQRLLAELIQVGPLAAIDTQARRVFPEKCDTNAIPGFSSRTTSYNMLAKAAVMASLAAVSKAARSQAELNLAITACALERYRLATGQYPERLDALVPKFIDRLPHDVVNGEPLKYCRTADGRFVLYSVGWNRTDDNGQVPLEYGGNIDWETGDRAWQYPPK
ncbi:MAG: hypothetical protein NZ739_10945 [Verrucomicrobiae bacterium]|nr:hypothetical protein [Verrucomicrobiae bacterium]